MALPKEPRQKMINIMYLVLTAMLAINISAEILNAFKTIDNSLQKTNETVYASTNQIMQSLSDKLKDATTAEKAAIWQPKAQSVIEQTKALNEYIESIRSEILTGAGWDPNDPEKKWKEDDQNLVTRIMINEGKGKELFQKLEAYKNSLLQDTLAKNVFGDNFPVDLERLKGTVSNKKSWEEDYFYMAPTVGALSILSKFQNDIRTTENRLVNAYHDQVGKVQLVFDSFEAIVGQNSKYLLPGQEIEITAGLGAFSSQKKPTITIGGSSVAVNEKGMAVYKASAGGVGTRTIPVVVSFTDQDGRPQTRNFNVEYTVGSASASIALDKMNVLYTGVDNPVTIAASGGSDNRVNATISGAGNTLTKVGNGKYIAKVANQGGEAAITVSIDGKVVGQSNFRVRQLPDPVATVGRSKSGNITEAEFKAASGISAWLEGFPFDIKFWVTSFNFSTFDDDEYIVESANTGNTFNNQTRNYINRFVKRGKIVMITNIKASGEDGVTRTLPSLTFNIK